MAVVSLDEFIKVESKPKRRYRQNEHVVFEHRRGRLAISLSPQAIDRFSLVAGLDYCIQTLEGDKVILTFHRKGGFAT